MIVVHVERGCVAIARGLLGYCSQDDGLGCEDVGLDPFVSVEPGFLGDWRCVDEGSADSLEGVKV